MPSRRSSLCILPSILTFPHASKVWGLLLENQTYQNTRQRKYFHTWYASLPFLYCIPSSLQAHQSSPLRVCKLDKHLRSFFIKLSCVCFLVSQVNVTKCVQRFIFTLRLKRFIRFHRFRCFLSIFSTIYLRNVEETG